MKKILIFLLIILSQIPSTTLKLTVINYKNKIKSMENNISNTIDTNHVTYIKGILLVNKKYGLPKDYGNGIDATALYYLHQMQSDALSIGLYIPVLSAYRSYDTQKEIYNIYYQKDGLNADRYSARPGHSEHQTGLAFDVGRIDDNYINTPEGIWLNEMCSLYGFIIRYPKDKENITGYKYEPWHIRYVGDVSTYIMNNNLTLEEYLEVE